MKYIVYRADVEQILFFIEHFDIMSKELPAATGSPNLNTVWKDFEMHRKVTQCNPM